MSNTKTVMGQAANTLAKPLDVEDVFSTYLYEGTGSTQTITNGIDLDGEGGLVWLKNRDAATNHRLYTTDLYSGSNSNLLQTNLTTGGSNTGAFELESFNSNGFTLGYSGGAYSESNGANTDYASWTFRKAPKFFDVVTWTGDGTASRQIAHNLGATPGMILVKITSEAGGWAVYHRGNTANPETQKLRLDNTDATSTHNDYWADTTPTSTHFTIGSDGDVNQNAATYVAYLFAHNDGDGGFGAAGDLDAIKCGSYTGNNGQPHHVELGFEPQWLLVKNADLSTGGTWWSVVDVQRGMLANTSIKVLKANESEAEINENGFTPTATGFTVSGNNDFQNNSTNTYIYIAIRRGTKVPESATEVFAIDTRDGSTPPEYKSGFPVDMALRKGNVTSTADFYNHSRLTQGKYLLTNSINLEASWSDVMFDYMNGYKDGSTVISNDYSWMWKRAPGYFDAVAYSGNSTSGRTVSHNLLGVAPEMMWVKNRDSSSNWQVYHKDLNGGTNPANYWLKLNDTDAEAALSNKWNDTEPTQSVFSVGNSSTCNASGNDYIAYLFASLPGISKLGSYTGTGNNVDVDCGFSSGARFILIRRSDSTSDWYVYDSERGIVSGVDPFLLLNKTDAEDAGNDGIDPLSSGFTVTSNSGLNTSGGTYIFYAIA